MRGVDDYTLIDGTMRSLDSTYERVFTNGISDFAFTDDPMYDPDQHSSQTCQRIEP